MKSDRKPRAYKIKDEFYLPAMKQCAKEKKFLAVEIEKFVTKIAKKYKS